MTKHTPTKPSKIWNLAKEDMSECLGHEAALMFLGAVLTRPIASELHEHFRALPGIWIHGPLASGKSTLATAAAMFLYPRLDLIPRIHPGGSNFRQIYFALLAQGQGHPIIEDWQEDRRNYAWNKLLRDIASGTPSKGPNGVDSVLARPLAVVGYGTSSDAALASRFLHFQPFASFTPEGQVHYRKSELYPEITEFLRNHRTDWARKVIALAEASESKVVPHLSGRESLLIRIAWASIVVAENYLDPEASPGRGLRRWLEDNSASLLRHGALA